MIWTVVLWLGMRGQSHVPCTELKSSWNNETYTATVIGKPDGCTWVVSGSSNDEPASAEHVFEIRTKRERVSDCDGAYVGEDGCFRITRELWMDGKRLGIIKGLD